MPLHSCMALRDGSANARSSALPHSKASREKRKRHCVTRSPMSTMILNVKLNCMLNVLNVVTLFGANIGSISTDVSLSIHYFMCCM